MVSACERVRPPTWGQNPLNWEKGFRGQKTPISHHLTKGRFESGVEAFRKVLRRFSNSKCFLEGFFEGACKGFQ